MARILVVDDEADERFLVGRVLKKQGHEVAVAGEGAAGLEAVREWSPDLVVTDIMMPVMDGVEFIRRLRGDPATAGIPILAASGAERALKRVASKVAGLDLVLGGGLAPGSVVVIAGPPGTGKTILAQQMCFATATAEHKCVYYTTMSEPHAKLVQHLEGFSFFDPQALGLTVEFIHMGDFLQAARQDGLEPLISEIVRKTLDDEPAVVVVDSARMLGDFADQRELRRALYDLTGRISRSGTVLLLLGEYAPEELRTDVVFPLADGIIELEYEAREPLDRRCLRIVKMRGQNHRSGKHTFRIGPDGVEVFPRIETLVPQVEAPLSGQVASGIAGLDELMGGGARRGDASVITGPSGVGKTIVGLRWLVHAMERGENGLYITFQDTGAQLTGVAAGFGWDLAACEDSGQLVISYVPMGDLDLDALATSLRLELARRTVGWVVIDSLSELAAAGREEQRFPAYMRSLVGLVRATGASLLITSETSTRGLPGSSLEELLFLFDNVIDLRYIEEGSQIGRAAHVAKMRSKAHAMTLNAVTITDHGLEIGGPLESVTGRLGWSALRTPSGTGSPPP
jgi:circadian clock protein KaiC